MIKKRFNFIYGLILSIAAVLTFTGGDCGTNDANPQPAASVAAPTNVNLRVDAVSGGSSFAQISWSASADESNSNFKGYQITTYNVDDSNNVAEMFNTQSVDKNVHLYNVNSINKGSKYISYVYSMLADGTKSDSVATDIYGGVYFYNDAAIDEYTSSGAAKSGFGWSAQNGFGQQYSYVQSNASNIDLHLRKVNDRLKFFSPDQYPPGEKSTKISLVGQGQSAFDNTNLDEPTAASVDVDSTNVYLLKTQEGYYVKIWVKTIGSVDDIPPYNHVVFDYKVQPISGLRILKR